MRDFLPEQVRRREYVIGVIKSVYEKYGFEPLETPSIENLSTLTNKYGEEGDQLIFKILKRGEKLEKELKEGIITDEEQLSDLALRYDLTVPLARVIANYKNELPKFFRRYQIQPVWRADRPAKGRFREFYQCDVDAIGSKSILVEADLCAAVTDILKSLGFEYFEIRVNHREALKFLIEKAGIPSANAPAALVSLDKIDKIGSEKVLLEMISRGIDARSAETFLNLAATEDSDSILALLKGNVAEEDIRTLLELNLTSPLKLDLTLARGISYYTGMIFEVVLTDGDFTGSIAGGGRYDGLIGMFGKEDIPAAGISLGLERILFVMEAREMFPKNIEKRSADVLVAQFNKESLLQNISLANFLRSAGIRVLIYPQADKLGKQFAYADQIGVEWVLILGESEIAENKITLKNMLSGTQETVVIEDAVKLLTQ